MENLNEEYLNEYFSKCFASTKDANMFKDYMIAVLENKPNQYGVFVLQGHADPLLNILRSTFSKGDIYNSWHNPRDSKERLIRHDDNGARALKLIKKTPSYYHVYLWCLDISDVIKTYEKNNIPYTVCNSVECCGMFPTSSTSFYRDKDREVVLSMLRTYKNSIPTPEF